MRPSDCYESGARDLEAIGDTWGVLNLELVAVILSSVIGDTESARREYRDACSRVPGNSQTPRTW